MSLMNLSLSINAEDLNVSPEQLKKLRIGLDRSEAIYRLVPQNRWQIQLLSLGERKDDERFSLIEDIKKIILNHSVFFIQLNGIWAYPNQKEARVLWIGVQNSIKLRSLQKDLAEGLIPSHIYQEDRVYKPTLPLARIKNHRDVTDIISPYKNTDFGKLQVHKLRLYDMISGGAFPVYEKIDDFQLSKEDLRQKESSDFNHEF